MDRKYISKTNTKSKYGNHWNLRCILCLVPSLMGMVIFFLIPYLRMLYYSVINNQFQRKLVGLANYEKTFHNSYFQLALKNSMLLIFIAVPLLMILSLFISFLITYLIKHSSFLQDLFVFPMFVPTAAIVPIWHIFFDECKSSMPIYALFVWKNIGLCIILLTASLTTIDSSIYEAAQLDGAKMGRIHWKITIPMISPTIFFVMLLSVVNTFKVFKESYLYYGGKYPPNHSYTLQYYMNNHFLKFDYQALASGSVITSFIVILFIVVGLLIQRRFRT